MLDLLTAIILGLVEGVTEFIPVSSTGHLIIAGSLLNFTGEKASTFEIFIQLGAILAVVILYFQRFLGLFDFKKTEGLAGFNGIKLVVIACLPALIMGFLLHDFIKKNLFNPVTVVIALAVGGIAIILVERFVPKGDKVGLDAITWREALAIGLFQCLALWPGMSRSASTIVGGMLFKVERKTAAEFSFFIAVPILVAATGYDLLKSLKVLQVSDIPLFAVGFVVAFLSAFLAIRFFIDLLGKYTLSAFGWYRILIAVIFLVLSISNPGFVVAAVVVATL